VLGNQDLIRYIEVVIHLQNQLKGAKVVAIEAFRVDLKDFSPRREAATDRGLGPLLWREVSEGHQSQPFGGADESVGGFFRALKGEGHALKGDGAEPPEPLPIGVVVEPQKLDPPSGWEELDLNVGAHRPESGADEGRDVRDGRRVVQEGERQAILQEKITLGQPGFKEVRPAFPAGGAVVAPGGSRGPGGAKRKGRRAEEARRSIGRARGGRGGSTAVGRARRRQLPAKRVLPTADDHANVKALGWGNGLGGGGEWARQHRCRCRADTAVRVWCQFDGLRRSVGEGG
jgi:hypothetical protein